MVKVGFLELILCKLLVEQNKEAFLEHIAKRRPSLGAQGNSSKQPEPLTLQPEHLPPGKGTRLTRPRLSLPEHP